MSLYTKSDYIGCDLIALGGGYDLVALRVTRF